MPPLYELILEIERGDIRGGQLLNLLHKKCHCGVPELQTCIQRYAVFFTRYIFSFVKMLVMSFPSVCLVFLIMDFFNANSYYSFNVEENYRHEYWIN